MKIHSIQAQYAMTGPGKFARNSRMVINPGFSGNVPAGKSTAGKFGKFLMMLAALVPSLGMTSLTPGRQAVAADRHERHDRDDESRQIHISGKVGPYVGAEHGNFGRNAAVQFARMEQETNPVRMENRAILRYSPQNATPSQKIQNAFGYNGEMTALTGLDTNKDGKLSPKELNRWFQGNMNLTKYYVRLLDRPGADGKKDGKIDIPEQTALLLFEDNATQLINAKVQELQNDPGKFTGKTSSGKTSSLLRELKIFHFAEILHHPDFISTGDGAVTPAERHVSHFAQQHLPILTGMILDDLMTTHGLRAQYEAFHQ